MKKRLLTMLIALCMIASLFPLSAFAEEPELEAITEETIESYDALDAYAEPESYVESPHEHAYVPYVTEPTCTTQGYTTYVCACGESYVDNYIDALNHPQVIDIAEIPATCTTDGVSAGKQCSLCEQILEGCEVIPATGHFSMDVAEISATETATGVTAGTKCAVCGEILSGCEAIPVLMPITEPEPASEAADSTTKDELAQPGEEAFEQPAQ